MLRNPGQSIVLPLEVFRQAWRWQGLGSPHPVVGVGDLWSDSDTQRELENRILDALTKTGLARGGALIKPFREVLTVFAEADREFYGWVGQVESRRSAGILVAADEYGRALRLFRDDAHIRLEHVPFTDQAESLIDALPRVPGAPVPSLQAPERAFAGKSAPPGPAEQVAELMRVRRLGVHQVHAARPDRGGSRRRSEPITLLDLAGQGRVMTFLTDAGRGDPQVHCVSGAPAAIVRRLYECDAALRR